MAEESELEADETYEDDETEQTDSPHSFTDRLAEMVPVLISVIATIAALVLGYYSCGLQDRHDAAMDLLDQTKTCTDDLARFKRESIDLKRTSENCTIDFDKVTKQHKEAGERLSQVEGELKTAQAELDMVATHSAEIEKRVQQFNALVQRFRETEGDDQIDLIGRGGRMIITLPGSVRFEAGSAALSRDAEFILMEVAIALRRLKNRKFMITGHTDSRPLEGTTGGRYTNNWELSAARALNVLQFFLEARLPPGSLLVGGAAASTPIADNRTPRGRQLNRRIEIELMPNPGELPWLEQAAPITRPASP